MEWSGLVTGGGSVEYGMEPLNAGTTIMCKKEGKE